MHSCVKHHDGRRRFSEATGRGLRAAGGALLCCGVLSGCQQQPPPEPTPAPLVIDEAMQRRNWEPSTNYYPSGDVVAGVRRFLYQPAADEPEVVILFIEPIITLGQTIALPFTYLVAPPGTAQRYRGEITDPSYTAMPEMPSAEATEADPLAPRSLEAEKPPEPEPFPGGQPDR